jgi:hypothetical protein
MARTALGHTVHLSTTPSAKGAFKMLADFEYRFNQHDATIRRAESSARLAAELARVRPASLAEHDRPRRRLSTLLRRLAGTAGTAA